MSVYCSSHRVPRAPIDPIVTESAALVLLDHLVVEPSCHQTIAFLLDHEYRAMSILSVVGTVHPDAVFDVADRIIGAAHQSDEFGAAILTTVRPDGASTPPDVARWMELSDEFEQAGIELVEWFVAGRSISCPRELLGEPPRWAT